MPSETRTEPIRLVFSERDAHVVIEPADEDRFVMRVNEAIEACRVYEEFQSLFRQQLDYLKNTLGTWRREHMHAIEKAFLTLQDDRMLFLVVMAEKGYDSTLEDDLTELELRIAQDPACSRIKLDVQALPSCDEHAYVSFCNPAWMLEYTSSNAD